MNLKIARKREVGLHLLIIIIIILMKRGDYTIRGIPALMKGQGDHHW